MQAGTDRSAFSSIRLFKHVSLCKPLLELYRLAVLRISSHKIYRHGDTVVVVVVSTYLTLSSSVLGNTLARYVGRKTNK
jgi:hypothetical protein